MNFDKMTNKSREAIQNARAIALENSASAIGEEHLLLALLSEKSGELARCLVEKGQKTAGDTMDAVARSLPALIRAEKIQGKARKVGFDWNETERAVEKLSEEVEELKQAIRDNSNTQEELGDVLFAAAKVGRFLNIDSEQALHGTCEKFIRRFRGVEQLAEGKDLRQFTLAELEQMWAQAKKLEK